MNSRGPSKNDIGEKEMVERSANEAGSVVREHVNDALLLMDPRSGIREIRGRFAAVASKDAQLIEEMGKIDAFAIDLREKFKAAPGEPLYLLLATGYLFVETHWCRIAWNLSEKIIADILRKTPQIMASIEPTFFEEMIQGVKYRQENDPVLAMRIAKARTDLETLWAGKLKPANGPVMLDQAEESSVVTGLVVFAVCMLYIAAKEKGNI